jgi:hypothetical protein
MKHDLAENHARASVEQAALSARTPQRARSFKSTTPDGRNRPE